MRISLAMCPAALPALGVAGSVGRSNRGSKAFIRTAGQEEVPTGAVFPDGSVLCLRNGEERLS